MKIAIFHNYLDNIGGAERVGLTLARDLNADIYSTSVNQESIKKQGFNVSVQSIGSVPINAPFRQQATSRKFRNLNLKDQYDYFIIDGDWAMSGAVNNKPNLWYVHSPIREIWDLYEYTRKNKIAVWQRPFFDLWVSHQRKLNKRYLKHVGKIVCNSINTQQRVKKYLNRDSIVINPPIETNKFYYSQNGDYWLSVSRLTSHKRIDLQMKAFRKLPNEKLIIVGCYEQSKHFLNYTNYIKKIKPPNVTLLRSVTFNKLVELYANCKGFITTAMDEDFGMTPVEAMASGKPVIAANEGGYKETIIDNVTGKLIDNINVDKLVRAIKEVGNNPESYKKECLKQAKKFDVDVFIKKIKEQIQI
ncbi:glycosyltransferase [Candidatus Woesearchaeota archaeon]|nr:glycosyltransferase [Candidatus Woesearchaeota archaeon]